MIATYNAALTTGTHRNRTLQAAHYIKFCLLNDFPYLTPSIQQACIYIQHLANCMSAPATHRNYISGVRSWLSTHGGDPSTFSSPEACSMLKGAARLSTHISNKAPPLTPDDIKLICDYIDKSGPQGDVLKAATLITYFTFLRQSNTTSPDISSWGGHHTLKRADILQRPHGLTVIVRSSKTIIYPSQAVALKVHYIPGSRYCPVTAWRRYCDRVPAPNSAPAFLLTPGHTPLTAPPLVAIFREALGRAGVSYASSVTMHSLRRGGAQAAAEQGAGPDDLCDHGTWSTRSSLAAYVPKDKFNEVPSRLSAAFASI